MSSEFDDIVIIGTSPASSLPKHRRTSSRDSQSNTDVMDSETRFPPFSSSSDAPGPAVSSLPHRYPPHSCLTDTLKEPPPSVNKPKNTSTSVQTHTSTSANPPMGASFNVNSKMAVVPMELLLELTRGGSRQNDGEPRYNQKGMNPVDYPGPFQSVPFGLPPPPLPQPPPPMPGNVFEPTFLSCAETYRTVPIRSKLHDPSNIHERATSVAASVRCSSGRGNSSATTLTAASYT